MAIRGNRLNTVARKRAKEENNVNLSMNIIDDYYDVITLWDIIEHLRNPEEEIKKLMQHLAPKGKIFIETPNWENWQGIVSGEKWGLYLFDHQYYFSPNSLEQLLYRCGLSRVSLVGGIEKEYPWIATVWKLGPIDALSTWWKTNVVWRAHGK